MSAARFVVVGQGPYEISDGDRIVSGRYQRLGNAKNACDKWNRREERKIAAQANPVKPSGIGVELLLTMKRERDEARRERDEFEQSADGYAGQLERESDRLIEARAMLAEAVGLLREHKTFDDTMPSCPVGCSPATPCLPCRDHALLARLDGGAR